MASVKRVMSSKVSIRDKEHQQNGEGPKPKIICGLFPASKWLEMIAAIQIGLCMIQLVIVSCTPLDWPGEKLNDEKMDVDGILPHLRPWTNGNSKALRIVSVIFSFISLMMSAVLIRAVTKKLVHILYMWIIWLAFKVTVAWTSACSLYYVNVFLILLLLGQTEWNLFILFLIITLTREITAEQQQQQQRQSCCEELGGP